MTEAMVLSMLGGAAGLVTAGLLLGALDRWHCPMAMWQSASMRASIWQL